MNQLTTHIIRSSRDSALVLVALCTPLLAVILLSPGSRDVARAAAVNGLITFPVVLVAAMVIYVHWRMSGHQAVAWVVVALIVTALVGAAHSALVLAQPAQLSLRGEWVAAPQLGLGSVLLFLAVAAGRREMHRDPALIGLGLGLAMTLVLLGMSLAVDPVSVPGPVTVLLHLVVGVMAFLIAAVLLRLWTLEPWVRRRLAAAVLLINAGQSLAHLRHDSIVLNGLTIVVNTVGVALLCGTALALLRWSLGESTYELVLLHGQLEEVEAAARIERERLHEIGSTIAGIASASHVIREGSGVSAQRKHLLEAMLDSEIERLERLMAARAPLAVRAFSVDETLQQLVVSQEARGRVVNWTPTGHRAVGQPDELAETVHILLENAARHSGTGVVTIEVRHVGDDVEIAVSDDGPGVCADVLPHLFEWGSRSPASPGQGIGLHIARTLMTKNGGSLELAPSATTGARFVACLPMVRVAHAACTNVA